MKLKTKVYTRTARQKQGWDILENPQYTRILFHGGARSGKTDTALLWLVKEAAQYPGCRILIARRFLSHARNTIWQLSLRNILKGIAGFRLLESNMEIFHDNGSFIKIDGLDDQERVDRILGDEYSHIFINEATQTNYETVQTVLTRLSVNVHGLPARKLLLDCNPKSQRHWLHKWAIQHRNPDTGEPIADISRWADLHWIPEDNPHLPEDYIETLKALTGAKRRRMLEGVWCDNEGAVYDEFDEDVHTVDPFDIPPQWTHVRGIDFGYTNPFVCLWGAIDPDGRLYIYRERYLAKVLTRDHAIAIKAVDSSCFKWTVADHDAEERAELEATGIHTKPAKKDVRIGIDAVKERLKVLPDGKPRLIIFKNCPETISEFYDYVWEPPKDGKNAKEEPVKDRDHATDVVRYVTMELKTTGSFKIDTASIYETR